MTFVPITKIPPIIQIGVDLKEKVRIMNEEAERMRKQEEDTVWQARRKALEETVTGDAETIQLVTGALPGEVDKPEFIDIGQPITDVPVPECPLLERKQIVAKLGIAQSAVMQAGCHLAHVADTYKRTGNEQYYEMTAAVLVTLDAARELLEALETFA